MRDIWNPWHGCIKCSEGCENCYMYFLDRMRDRCGSEIYRTKNGFRYPLQKDKSGAFKIPSGACVRVCMTSDFFLEQADCWREEAWELMRARPDVRFFLLTKRPERVETCLPSDWGSGWEHIFFNVTCENQKRTDERMPLLLQLPFRHKGVMCAPLIGPIRMMRYLTDGQVEQVICGGENYEGARECNFDWVRTLHEDCRAANVTFCFIETGTNFRKNGKLYHLPDKHLQSRMAYRSGMYFAGKPAIYHLTDRYGEPLPDDALYHPKFRITCEECGGRPICNGCSDCGKCKS